MNGTLGAGLSSGWVHGWMIPFMSKYKLSNSTWFGLGFVMSTGCLTPLHSWDWSKILNRKHALDIYNLCNCIHNSIHNIVNNYSCRRRSVDHHIYKIADLQKYFRRARYTVLPTFSSKQSIITEGYFFVNHRKNAGTPILKSTKVLICLKIWFDFWI